jgi:hypothetical protein
MNLSPSQNSSTPFLPPKCYKLGNIPQLLFLPLFSPLNSHLCLSRSLGVRQCRWGKWPWTMCPHTFLKKLKPLVKSSRIKQSHKSSYTILKRLPNERRGEWTKMKINASWSKTTFVFGWRPTPTNVWKGEKVLWFHQMGLLKCLKPMHTLLVHNLLHVPMCDVITLMQVEKDLNPFPKIFGKLEFGF